MGSLWDENGHIERTEAPNKYLENEHEALKLITNLLATDTSKTELDKQLTQLRNIFEKDYIKICNQIEFQNELDIYLRTQKKIDDLENLVSFPQVFDKKIIAVGGGFSSGKSKFINSILQLNGLLPTDTKETTSIPTYIAKGSFTRIVAYNNVGCKCVIDEEAIGAITHEFSLKYNLSFTRALKSIVVESQNMPFEYIIVLDVPGYTKAEIYKKADNTDEAIARNHLLGADYLIWLIESKSPITDQDIDFIRSLQFEKPILFVLNKADKRTEFDLVKLIEETEKTIQRAGIKSEGITAYSSTNNQEYVHMILTPFFQKINTLSNKSNHDFRFSNIFESHLKHIEQSMNTERKRLQALNQIGLFVEKNQYEIVKTMIGEAQIRIKNLNQLNNDLKLIEKQVEQIVENVIEVELGKSHKTEITSDLREINCRKLGRRTCDEFNNVLLDFEQEVSSWVKNFNINSFQLQREVSEYYPEEIKEIFNIAKWYKPDTWGKKEVRVIPLCKTRHKPVTYIDKQILLSKLAQMELQLKQRFTEILKFHERLPELDWNYLNDCGVILGEGYNHDYLISFYKKMKEIFREELEKVSINSNLFSEICNYFKTCGEIRDNFEMIGQFVRNEYQKVIFELYQNLHKVNFKLKDRVEQEWRIKR